MLVATALQLLGLFAIGVLIALVVTPLILCATEIVMYTLALLVVLLRAMLASQLPPKKVFETFRKLMKDFPKYVNRPIYKSNSTNDNVRFPDAIDNTYGSSISQIITPQKPTDSKGYACDQNKLDMVKQPFIPDTLKKCRKLFHTIILFYKSYYGHSTKVEKNRCQQKGC
jgi:hypothetical protein